MSFFKTANIEPPDIFGGVIGYIDNGGRLEQIHEARKALGTPVVRGGAGHDQGVAGARQ